MCRKHLLGEHVECHMFVGALNKNKSIEGYISKGLLEIHSLEKRHDELAREMEKRGMVHKSPLPKYKYMVRGVISKEANLVELSRRCSGCKETGQKWTPHILQLVP